MELFFQAFVDSSELCFDLLFDYRQTMQQRA